MRTKTKCLLGILCILAGILILVCFAPSWLLALVVAFVLFSVGMLLIGFP